MSGITSPLAAYFRTASVVLWYISVLLILDKMFSLAIVLKNLLQNLSHSDSPLTGDWSTT